MKLHYLVSDCVQVVVTSCYLWRRNLGSIFGDKVAFQEDRERDFGFFIEKL